MKASSVAALAALTFPVLVRAHPAGVVASISGPLVVADIATSATDTAVPTTQLLSDRGVGPDHTRELEVHPEPPTRVNFAAEKREVDDGLHTEASSADLVQDLQKDWDKVYNFFLGHLPPGLTVAQAVAQAEAAQAAQDAELSSPRGPGPILAPLPDDIPVAEAAEADEAVEVSSLGVSDAASPTLNSMFARDVIGTDGGEDGELEEVGEDEEENSDGEDDDDEGDEDDDDEDNELEKLMAEFNVSKPPPGVEVLRISSKMGAPSIRFLVDMFKNINKSETNPDGIPYILLHPPVLPEATEATEAEEAAAAAAAAKIKARELHPTSLTTSTTTTSEADPESETEVGLQVKVETGDSEVSDKDRISTWMPAAPTDGFSTIYKSNTKWPVTRHQNQSETETETENESEGENVKRWSVPPKNKKIQKSKTGTETETENVKRWSLTPKDQNNQTKPNEYNLFNPMPSRNTWPSTFKAMIKRASDKVIPEKGPDYNTARCPKKGQHANLKAGQPRDMPNGCGTGFLAGLIPGSDKFRSCCFAHDTCYSNCAVNHLRTCNDKLYKCMNDICGSIKGGVVGFFKREICYIERNWYDEAVRGKSSRDHFLGIGKKRCDCVDDGK